MKTYIDMAACPFKIGDVVECLYSKSLSRVIHVVDEHVWCEHDGIIFYRTWSHDVGWNSGGWLKKKPPPTAVGVVKPVVDPKVSGELVSAL